MVCISKIFRASRGFRSGLGPLDGKAAAAKFFEDVKQIGKSLLHISKKVRTFVAGLGYRATQRCDPRT